ncbi:beta-ketoacyl synthase, partial [bacterium]|nr:beta-ketoacyl synthase [bacterium]
LFPDLPELKPEELAELRTLGEVVEHMKKLKPSMGASSRNEAAPQQPDIEDKVPRSIVKLKPLPPPDYLEFTQPDNHICLITDDGTSTTVRLAESLKNRGWGVVVLGLPSSTIPEQLPLSEDIPRVVLEDLSETHLKETLKAISDEYGRIRGLIHLNPQSQPESNDGILFSETSKDILRHVFLMAKHLKASLNQTKPAGRRFFITVAHLDGALGLGEHNFGVIDGGLFGVTKTLNLEWESVFCRAIDLSPEFDIDKSVSCILAELHDPDGRIVETGYNLQGRATLVAEKVERVPSSGHNGKIDPASVFVVSGGAKGVTAECVAKLASLYRCKFILLGRSLFSEQE